MIDAHCHLTRLVVRSGMSLEALLSRAGQAGVEAIVACACDRSDWEMMQEWEAAGRLTQPGLPAVYPQYGVHPWWAGTESAAEGLLKILREKHAGVGEIGLDRGILKKKNFTVTDLLGYTVSTIPPPFTDQLELFRSQLSVAMELDRPCTVHCVDAFGPLLAELALARPSCPVVLHSFGGSGEFVTQVMKVAKEVYFSVSAKCPRKETIAFIPLNRLLIETDSPDQGVSSLESGCVAGSRFIPVPLPGLNDCSQLFLVAARVAEAAGMPVSEVVRISAENARRAFRIG